VKDVRAMALPVMRHRVIPNYNALGEGIDSAAIVRRLLEVVGEPAAARA
jgi:MoxR-like ATPase